VDLLEERRRAWSYPRDKKKVNIRKKYLEDLNVGRAKKRTNERGKTEIKNKKKVLAIPGIEPGTLALLARCSNQLS
jgi:hypothetical protein